MGRRISPETYQAMVIAYEEQPDAKHVAKVTGVNWRTAQRYITEGDPDRGLAPIGETYREVRREARKIAVRDHAEIVAEKIALLDAAIGGVAKNLLPRLLAQDGAEPYEATVHELTTLIREQHRLMGGPDQVIEVRINAIMGVIVMQVDKALRSRGLGDHVEGVVRDLGESLREMAVISE